MYRRSLTRRHNGERERGSVLVELTMVLPLLITLVLGMMEMGMAWRDQQTIVQASRQGARVGSHLGDDATADQQAIEAALAVLDADQLANIRRIIVYKVTTADGAVPPNCLAVSTSSATGGVNGTCNVYNKAGIDSGTYNLTYWRSAPSTPGGTNGRKVTLTGTGPDRMGVYVEVHRPWFTGYFPGDGSTLRAISVMQLEPDLT
ncbi:MAG: TadE/TadG family type IV pilus assembly protein [Acidimicrobiales bacterium]